MTYYMILEISEDATPEQIKTAYRRLAMRWHPDRNLSNQKEATEKFKAINEAYTVLGDEELRRKYDEELRGGRNEDASADGNAESRQYEYTDEDLEKTFFTAMFEYASHLASQDNIGKADLADLLINQGCPVSIAKAVAEFVINNNRTSSADPEDLYINVSKIGRDIGAATSAAAKVITPAVGVATSLVKNVVAISVALTGLTLLVALVIWLIGLLFGGNGSIRSKNDHLLSSNYESQYSDQRFQAQPDEQSHRVQPSKSNNDGAGRELDRVIDQIEAEHPELNPDSPYYNQQLIDRALVTMHYHVSKGISQPVALRMAVDSLDLGGPSIKVEASSANDQLLAGSTSRQKVFISKGMKYEPLVQGGSGPYNNIISRRSQPRDTNTETNLQNHDIILPLPVKPANSHWKYSFGRETSEWECNLGFRKSVDSCEPLPPPPAHASYQVVGRDTWECNSGYIQLTAGGPCISGGTH